MHLFEKETFIREPPWTWWEGSLKVWTPTVLCKNLQSMSLSS